jgi:hypothetical protein
MDTRAVPPASADTARRANAHIAEMAERLDSIVENPRPIGFLCECGCLGIAEVPLADFRGAGGAWIEGHRRR